MTTQSSQLAGQKPSFELNNPPADGISNLRYSPDSAMLLVSSWDSQVRVYDVIANSLKEQYSHKAAVLDCSWVDNSTVISGSLDKTVKRYDLQTKQSEIIGNHDEAVRCVEWNDTRQVVITGSWDKSIRLWDLRAQHCQQQFTLPNKIFTMAHHQNRLVVGTAARCVEVFDLAAGITNGPEQSRESVLKYQTRCIRCFPDGEGYALSSTEGRVAMEYFNPDPEVQKLKYAFKCHRTARSQPGGTVDIVYPVNVIEFHPEYGTFATGGCDGRVNIWDGKNKKRICQFPAFKTSISALAFNGDGSQLAIAASYTYEEGEKEHEPDAIWIRNMSESEMKPKPRVVQ